MRYYCTFFDVRYLSRGLALYHSLKEHCPAFRLWVLCLDRKAHQSLHRLAQAEVVPILLEEFESGDGALLAAKRNRSLVEYYFTCTPSLPLFIFNHYPEVTSITYLDADLFFFADPAALDPEISDHSVAIIGHRFLPRIRYREANGVYNVGWLFFRRDSNALACLNWWRERCIEWCYDRIEPGRFGDQKYLDDWPTRFKSVRVLLHKGANLAPWNLANYQIQKRNGQVLVDEQPLIFFHFHGLKRLTPWLYNSNVVHYRASLNTDAKRWIYAQYIRLLKQVEKEETEPVSVPTSSKSPRDTTAEQWARSTTSLLQSVLRELRANVRTLEGLFACQYLMVIGKKVY
ncbi:MAG: glycosyl transferase [Acidobacteria bacterium]|nr:glycosyl transferase [Acidobacteriota bacterium]MCI0721146.1 glycosyl transferase [Acidobacteriota bacterium]